MVETTIINRFFMNQRLLCEKTKFRIVGREETKDKMFWRKGFAGIQWFGFLLVFFSPVSVIILKLYLKYLIFVL